MIPKNKTLNHLTLTVGWLYPDLMSTYGDRGNILVFQRRCEWRGITFAILPIEQEATSQQIESVDLIFGGGAQDREQGIVMHDLRGKKADVIRKKIDEGTPALFVCGSPQLMGKYYEPGEGQRIEGLGIFDIVSIHPGENKSRLIGNVVAEVQWENITSHDSHFRKESSRLIVGFENHGGRTYLGSTAKPFAKVIKGNGNNGEDGTEGVVYNNAIGCYFHGPLLPKNPSIADFLIQKALEVKYQESITLPPLDDTLEMKARLALIKRLGVSI